MYWYHEFGLLKKKARGYNIGSHFMTAMADYLHATRGAKGIYAFVTNLNSVKFLS